MRPARTLLSRTLVVVSALLAVGGCVTLPEAGPVSTVADDAGTEAADTFDYRPRPPSPGDDQAAIVTGFLDALRETPLTFVPARQYLTAQAATAWSPNRRTIVYADGTLETEVAGAHAAVRLRSTVELDARGSWLGDRSGGRGIAFDLRLTMEDGEWRIANPPDALLLSRSHFDARFVRYDLHFFDPSAQVLVPEPVYLPAGEQTPGLLVSGLLAGPAPSLRTVERTFFPTGTRLELSVPVEDGTADVPLTPEVLEADPAQLELALAQLAWTLRQVPGIERMRVTADGAPVDRTTGASTRSLYGWSAYDPAMSSADTRLHAVTDRGVAALDGEQWELVTPRFRADSRSLGVSLGVAGPTRLASVSSDGRRVRTVVAGPGQGPTLVYAGTDLLRPSYDRFDHLWLLDRTARGARLVVVGADGSVRPMRVPGLTRADVSALELSRDGTRLAAVVQGHVVIARISRNETGAPTTVARARPVRLGDNDTGAPVDVAWMTPASVGVLVQLGSSISQIVPAGVDGSFLPEEGVEPEPVFQRGDDVVTWPGVDAPLYLRTASGTVYVASSSGHWAPSSLPSGLRATTFPG